MFDNLTIEEVVDKLKEIRDAKKIFDAQEKALKQRILEDGRNEIQGNNATVKITIRSKEVFNEEAFIEKFKNDNSFEEAVKNTVLHTKLVIDNEALTQAVEDKIIPLEYVIPFNEVTESKVINVK
jgi:hypothetical protein